jgi:hypothetical protein
MKSLETLANVADVLLIAMFFGELVMIVWDICKKKK